MSTTDISSAPPLPSTWRQFHALTKPRVIQLIVFCALIGMVLAIPGLPSLSQCISPRSCRWLVALLTVPAETPHSSAMS